MCTFVLKHVYNFMQVHTLYMYMYIVPVHRTLPIHPLYLVFPQHTSILEQHHCRAAKAVVREAGLLDHLPAHQRQEITSLMEELILSTDFTRHKVFMANFEVYTLCTCMWHSLPLPARVNDYLYTHLHVCLQVTIQGTTK